MTEKSNLENAKMEIAHPGKYQNGKSKQPGKYQYGNCKPWKMTEKSHHRKLQKMHNWNLPEWKMHTLENARMEIARPGK